MSNDRAPRVMVFGAKWLGAEVASGLSRAGADVACIAPSKDDRAFRAGGIAAVAKPDRIALSPADFPWRPDLCICAGSFRIIPKWVMEWSRLGAIGYHPSLLPAFKGRHAISDAIVAGQRVTGGTVFWLTGDIDAGPALVANGRRLQTAAQVLPGECALSLWKRALAPLGRDLLIEAAIALFPGELHIPFTAAS